MTCRTHFINGIWQSGEGELLHKQDPLNQQVIWRGRTAAPWQVTAACYAARNALSGWSRLAPEQRLMYIIRFSQRLSQMKEPMARIISQETSKPLWDYVVKCKR